MNDAALFDDLKQFIDSRISQSESRLETRLDTKIDGLRDELRDEMYGIRSELLGEIGELRTEMREGFAGVADAMSASNDDIDRRLTKLEQQAV